jgi:hypothetical protein
MAHDPPPYQTGRLGMQPQPEAIALTSAMWRPMS